MSTIKERRQQKASLRSIFLGTLFTSLLGVIMFDSLISGNFHELLHGNLTKGVISNIVIDLILALVVAGLFTLVTYIRRKRK